MKHLLPLTFFLFLTVSLQAQLNNQGLEYRIRPDSVKTGELNLSIHNFNYLRNYEYFNKIQDGYTLYGAQLEPQLIYYAHPRLAVMAGIHLRKDFGSDGIYKTFPLFSIKYQKRNTALINGVLEGNVQHRFIEPVFDLEKKITEPVEYGTQLIVNKQDLFFDAFINWKRMIYKPSAEQEQLFAGASADVLLKQTEKFSLSVPAQLLAFHQGGQIDTVSAPLQTLVNTAIGFKLNFPLAGFINNIRTQNYFATFNDLSPNPQQAFLKGTGLYLNAGLDTRYGTVTGSYWNGNGFIAKNGMPIYPSVSQQINNLGYVQKRRELVIIRYAYQKQLIPNLYLDFRLEPLIDLNRDSGSQKIELSNSLFLVYRQQFRLLKAKNKVD